jgi:hypothetical protein
MKKTIELQANTSTPRGATIKLTVEYRSKIKKNPNCLCYLKKNTIIRRKRSVYVI